MYAKTWIKLEHPKLSKKHFKNILISGLLRQPVSKMAQDTRDDSTRGHHQMVNTKIRLMVFFAAQDGEALYSQQKKKKKDWELTMAQIMNSLLQNSDLS